MKKTILTIGKIIEKDLIIPNPEKLTGLKLKVKYYEPVVKLGILCDRIKWVKRSAPLTDTEVEKFFN